MLTHRICAGAMGRATPSSTASSSESDSATVDGQQKGDGFFRLSTVRPLFHRVGDGGKVVIGQHGPPPFRCFGGFGAFAHRHAHIGLFECGKAVHAVAGHGHQSRRWFCRARTSGFCARGWRGQTRGWCAPPLAKQHRSHGLDFGAGDGGERSIRPGGPDARPIPDWAAMALAVTTWSPVIITTRIPACWHSATARMAFVARRVDDGHQPQQREAPGDIGVRQAGMAWRAGCAGPRPARAALPGLGLHHRVPVDGIQRHLLPAGSRVGGGTWSARAQAHL